MKYMNLILDTETLPPNRRLHLMLDGERLCARQDPLPSQFIHSPSIPRMGSPFCAECQARLDTINQNNPNFLGV